MSCQPDARRPVPRPRVLVFPVFCAISRPLVLASRLLVCTGASSQNLKFPPRAAEFPPGISKGIFFGLRSLRCRTSEGHVPRVRLASPTCESSVLSGLVAMSPCREAQESWHSDCSISGCEDNQNLRYPLRAVLTPPSAAEGDFLLSPVLFDRHVKTTGGVCQNNARSFRK